MRHLKSGRKLGRTASHRKATLSNLAAAIIEHKSIITTTPKAKEARGVIERLITFAKRGDIAARRHVLRTIRNKELVRELFDQIAPKYKDRPGGYTRVIKIGQRRGDNAHMAVFELVGYEGTKAEKIEKARQKREARAKEEDTKEETEETEDE
jgi:large subunit ribosomal protein L17